MASSYLLGSSVIHRTKRTESMANGDQASDWSIQPEEIYEGFTTSGAITYNTSYTYSNVSDVDNRTNKSPYDFYKVSYCLQNQARILGGGGGGGVASSE